MEKLGSGLKKVLLAGIGAVAVTGEKSKELLDEMVKKGELTVEQGKALNPQGSDADGDDCRVIPEYTHDGSRKHDSDQGGNAHDNETAADAEPESFPHAAVFFRAVVEGADRLETLANAEGNTEQEHDDSCYNAHGRNGGIAVRGRALV